MRSVSLLLVSAWLAILPLCLATAAPDAGYALLADITYTPGQPRCVLDVYHPTDQPGFATIVWFHGGGLSSGEKYIPGGLKGARIGVVGANYRLMPRVGVETCLSDAAAALAWTLTNIERFGGDPRRVFVGGHSAGAYLATMLVVDPTWMAATGSTDVRAAGLLAISGQMITHFAVRQQNGISDTQVRVDATAPLFHVKDKLPAILLVTGDRELELLGRYEENAYFARMLRLAGNREVHLHELGGFNHGGVAQASETLMLKYVRVWTGTE
jgi:acetyl esterase/lipase